MGYVTKDIAVITEPKALSLSNAPNFVIFASKAGVKTLLQMNIKVNAINTTPSLSTVTLLRITEPTGAVHSFSGTTDPLLVSGSVFYVSTVKSDTAENLRRALLSDDWVSANFNVDIPAMLLGAAVINGETLEIKSKGTGADYNATIVAPNNTANAAYTLTSISGPSVNNDSISGEASTATIALDVYVDNNIFFGQDDRPVTASVLGTFATTLSKTYAGAPLWFDINALFAQYAPYNRPMIGFGWFNTGTLRAYRFAAKVQGINSFVFYQSNALYVLNGYGPVFETLDLNDYAYDGNTIRLLTNKPRTSYIRGQKEYLNFILKDIFHGQTVPNDFTLRIAYRAYSTSDAYLGTVYSDELPRNSFNMVNTCAINIDAVLSAYPTAGIVRVSLARGTAVVSSDLEYNIRPEALHRLRQVVFLNRLGGWDAFNFDALPKADIKPTTDTFTRTITPDMSRGDSVETVYNTSLAQTVILEGAPVNDAVAEWLKELAAASVIFDGEGNYIVREDFALPITPEAINMRTPTMKYHLSESYTND